MQNNFIRFGKPNILSNELNDVKKVIKSKWIGTGPLVQKFEKNFSKYKGTKNAISLNSCTAGLHLSLKILNLKKKFRNYNNPINFLLNYKFYNNVRL